jgi:ParB family transcriptional regulator, chromosome partitioning protein
MQTAQQRPKKQIGATRMAVKRGLGRGLDALLNGNSTSKPNKKATLPEIPQRDILQKVAIDQLKPGVYQPRKHMDPEALEDLSQSIKSQGILQPLLVRAVDDGYEIIAGERRWRAAQQAKLKEVPVLIRELSDQAILAIALIENIQRENLNPMEESMALQRLIDEFSMTHQAIAEIIGRSRSTISNLLRLQSLHTDVKYMLENNDLEMGHARALLSLSADAQHEIAREIVSQALSVREAEKLVRQYQQPPQKTSTKNSTNNPDTLLLQTDLAEKLGAKVKISHNTSGKGKLQIQYNSLDELEGILAHIA